MSPGETICMKCQIIFLEKNKKNLINLARKVIIRKCLCEKKKKGLLLTQCIYILYHFQQLSFDEATKIVLLEINAEKKHKEGI